MNVINYIIFILFFLIMYSISFKTIEGFDDDFYYYNKLIDYKTIPPSFVNDATPSRTVNKFGFYKGKGTFKKGYTKESKSDEKISTLNTLLNRLLGRIVSDNQDCVGSFGKYSECDKSCGSNAFQTRKYNITQQRGKNGKDCPFVDGYEERLRCNLDECQLGDICENNADCETGNCNPDSTRCENMVPCDSDNVHVCNETQCINLNNDNNNDNKMIEGSYIYNNVDKECFFKTPAEIEELNLNIYTYDFDEIKDKLKDIVLDCEYYQVEKEEGIGPCVNRPNVIIDDSGEPKCSTGFGPEPTMFNASYACSKCILKDRNNNPLSKDECYCPPNTTINDDGKCGDSEGKDTSNLCSDILKVNNNGCNYCNNGYSFKKEGDTASCIQCPSNQQTLREFCIRNCNPTLSPEYNEICTQYCDGIVMNSITDNAILPFLDLIPASSIPVQDLQSENYKERCIDFSDTLSTSKIDICDSESSPILNDFCYCNGSGENGEPTTNSDCRENCKTGFIWNDASGQGQCVACPKLPESICTSSNENFECVSLNQRIYNKMSSSDTGVDIATVVGTLSGGGAKPWSPDLKVQHCSEVAIGEGLKYYIDDGEVAECQKDFSDDGFCNECQSGTYEDASGECQNCPAGKFNETYNCVGDESSCCQGCPAGSVSDAGSSSCRECEKGHYSNDNKTECLPCGLGHYQDQRGQSSCEECPAGTYQNNRGRQYCYVKKNCWADPDGIKYYTDQGSSQEDSQCNVSPTINRWCTRGNGDDPPQGGSYFQGPVWGSWYHLIGDCDTNYSNYTPWDNPEDETFDPISHYNCKESHNNTNELSSGESVDGGSLHKNQIGSGPESRPSGSGYCNYTYGCIESSSYCYLKPTEENKPDWEQEIKRWYDAGKTHLDRVTDGDLPSDTSSR